MSSRSIIFYKKEDGTLKGSYFHFDGYVEYTGLTLLKHYDSYDKVKELVEFNSANSIILESVVKMFEEKVAYKNSVKYYHFDSVESLSREIENGEHWNIEFVYIFDKDSNSWAFAMPERIGDTDKFQILFMDLKKYCLDEDIKFGYKD